MRQIQRLILLSALSSLVLATPAFGTEITITSPGDTDTIALGTNVGVTFVASGIGAAEERVGGIQFLVGGTSILFLGVVDGVAVDPPNDVIPPPFEITWTPQELGTFNLTARVFDINGTATDLSDLVSVTVEVGEPPDVPTIDSPAGGSTILTNTTITIEASATDNDGVITQVEFFVNGQSIGVVTDFPYSTEFLLPDPDTYVLQVVSTDNTGFTTASATTTITAITGASPSVSITSPSTSTLSPNTEITITANAADSDGLIAQVEFFVNDVSIGADTSTPYTANFTVPSPGSYAITAVATDNSGNATTSATVTITSATVGGGTGTLPTVSITTPLNGAILFSGTNIFITADAFDSDGLIEKVEFFVNGSLVGASFSIPFFDPYVLSSPGTYIFTAVATDDDGNTTTSSAVSVTSISSGDIGTSPTVSITSPIDGEAFPPGTVLELTADAFDADGLIDLVTYFVNGQVVAFSSVYPYAGIFTLPSPGDYAIRAVTKDESGNSTISATVTVTSSTSGEGGGNPTVSILSPPDGVSFIPGSTLTLAAIASDPDGLVDTVEFFVNGVSVRTVSNAPFQTQFSLPTTGTFVITAVATDNLDNTGTSPAITVTAGPADNETPRVVIDHPLPVGGGDTINDVSVASSMYLNASAIDPDGEIKEVRFYANNLLLGTVTQGLGDRYALFFDPITEADLVFFAEAEDFNGNVGQSVPLTLDVGPLESVFPEVELTLVSPIDPKVSVQDKVVFKVTVTETLTIGVGFSLVTFYADGVYIGIVDPDTGSDTVTFAWFPDVAGNFNITARVIQLDPNGFTFDNWIITDPLALSVLAVSENRVLLEQTVEDLLNDELTQDEADALIAALDSGQITFSQAIEEIFQSDDSDVAQGALMARFLLTGAWPDHDLLFQDKLTIEQDGLSRLVEILIPAFQAEYLNSQNLPDAFSSDAERTEFIEILFDNKYGVAPDQEQIDSILPKMIFLGANRFIELFIQDIDVITFASSTISRLLAIPNPPNDQLPRLADAASLLINLLRTEPSASEVSALE